MKKPITLLFLLIAAISFSCNNKEEDPTNNLVERKKQSIIDELENYEELSMFAAELKKTDLSNIDISDGLTIFALPNSVMSTFSSLKSGNEIDFDIYDYMWVGYYPATVLSNGTIYKSASGKELFLSNYFNDWYVNGFYLYELVEKGSIEENVAVYGIEMPYIRNRPYAEMVNKIFYNDKLLEQYFYDASLRISHVDYYDDDNISRSCFLYYDNRGDISKIIYQYSNGVQDIIEFDKSNLKYTFKGSTDYIEFKSNMLPKQYSFADTIQITRRFEYDPNGNIKAITDETKYGTFSTTYKYDSKYSPFHDCQTPKWFFIIMNENMNYIHPCVSWSNSAKSSGTSVYEYNQESYPTKCVKYENKERLGEYRYEYNIIPWDYKINKPN